MCVCACASVLVWVQEGHPGPEKRAERRKRKVETRTSSEMVLLSGGSQRYRCRDDREWEGCVWVARNQVHFSQHLPIQQCRNSTTKQLCKCSHAASETTANPDCKSAVKAQLQGWNLDILERPGVCVCV